MTGGWYVLVERDGAFAYSRPCASERVARDYAQAMVTPTGGADVSVVYRAVAEYRRRYNRSMAAEAEQGGGDIGFGPVDLDPLTPEEKKAGIQWDDLGRPPILPPEPTEPDDPEMWIGDGPDAAETIIDLET